MAAGRALVWDSWLLLPETTATPGSGVTRTRTYTCSLDLSGQLGGEGIDPISTAGGTGGILAVTSTSSALPAPSSALFLYGGNGNAVDLADAGTAAVLATYEYGPFGNTLVASAPLVDTNPIRFSTKYAETAYLPGSAAGPDLYYYGRRYYTPGLGRWVSRDPIRERGGLNLFGFVHNSPVGLWDPDGRKVRICCRDVQVSFAMNCAARICGKKHCWLSADTKKAGMGPAVGGVDDNSYPCCGDVQTVIVDGSGEVPENCYEIPGADEECVNRELVVGKPLGEWGRNNNCNTFVATVLGKCNGMNVCKRWVLVPPELPGEIPLRWCAEWTAPPDILPPLVLQ